jgi:hypothetical protein
MNSRTKGHEFERKMAEKLREVFPECFTTRFKGSLWLDHCGVDLVGTPGYNVQLKAMERTPAYHDILNYMPKGQNKNLIIHKKNNRGCVAVLRLDDFIALLKELNHDKNSCDGRI